MKVQIGNDRIFSYEQGLVDAEGKPTGKYKTVVQFSVSFPGISLPSKSFGVVVGAPPTRKAVEQAVKRLAAEVEAQVKANHLVRKWFEEQGLLEFEV